MKRINFISPIPAQKKKEIRRWIIITILLCSALFLFIGFSLFARGYQYYLLQQQRAQAEQDHAHCSLVLQTQKDKETLHGSRSQHLAKLRNYQSQPNTIVATLRTCQQAISAGALQSCTIDKRILELSYTSPTIQHAQQTLKKIGSIPDIHLPQLVSLQRHNNTVSSTVKAKMNNA